MTPLLPSVDDSVIHTDRLTLSPVALHDASEMHVVLADQELYSFTGGAPPSLDDLLSRYRKVESRRSPDGSELWLNWIVRLRDASRAIGYVQASVTDEEAELAWVIGLAWQRQGFATEAARAVVAWLTEVCGVSRFYACTRSDHIASRRVAFAVGLRPTTEFRDGEEVWRLTSESG